MNMDSTQRDVRMAFSPQHQLMQQHRRIQAAAKGSQNTARRE
ncbi:hypothetical protein SEENIN0B_00246 [Salmonella enterica subsp. enterica serovar Infantis str. SARB27]|uniref:Uncharacterized protein n=1 Tax=Salmonella enterica subsp. enterica serovar Infantis str. SARB27 TaxID=596155 RepID=A0A6C8GD34_SALIN|nr:hypothetical protein SEENIN0B_00246 [Salmonella enterica subsp. enterica serovar Infantis str. SARB27]